MLNETHPGCGCSDGSLNRGTSATCLGVDLGGDAGEFFDHLPGKLRYDIRRARTRAEAIGTVTFESLAPSPAQISSLFLEFMSVEAAGWKGRKGTALAGNPTLRERSMTSRTLVGAPAPRAGRLRTE